MIQMRYFARLRESLGIADEQLTLPPTVTTVQAVVAHLRQRGGVWDQALGPDERLLVAVNQVLAQATTRVRDSDEVALFPPVTGG